MHPVCGNRQHSEHLHTHANAHRNTHSHTNDLLQPLELLSRGGDRYMHSYTHVDVHRNAHTLPRSQLHTKGAVHPNTYKLLCASHRRSGKSDRHLHTHVDSHSNGMCSALCVCSDQLHAHADAYAQRNANLVHEPQQ